MPDFSHLKKYDVDPVRTVWYDLFQLEGVPRLLISAATEQNSGYYDDLLARTQRSAIARAARGNRVSTEVMRINRDQERESYAQHILHGWEHVTERDGTSVPFSPENALEFLKALPDDIFDEIRVFASNAANFRSMSDPATLEEIAGNSRSG